MMSKPFLELAGVSLRINNRLVFRNTHWTFGKDQNWALIGSNGSGKTLLGRSIAGELPIAKREIRYGFRTPSGSIPEDFIALVSFEQQKALAGDSPPAARWFSTEQDDAPLVKQFLSQDSVEEVNPFEVKIRPPESAVRFARLHQRIAALLEIHSLMDCALPSLSNGEMRKILLARALLKRPRLLILDDVFAGLDSRFREHLKGILDKLMFQGTAHILLIGSRPSELPRGITHLLWIHNCRIAQSVLVQLGIGKLRPHPFGTLSTGLQRMTLLARAIVKAPALLLLDEPCQGLDPAHRKMFLEIIESVLRHSQTTMIYVTHVADKIPRGIQKMLQLKNGRVFRSRTIPRNAKTVL